MLHNSNINTRTSEEKKRQNNYTKELQKRLAPHIKNTAYNSELYSYLYHKIDTLVKNKAKNYIRYIFQKLGVDKKKFEQYVSDMYKELITGKYIKKLTDNIIAIYEDKNDTISGSSYKDYVNNIITLKTDNLPLDEKYLDTQLSRYITYTDKMYNSKLRLLTTYITTEIILIWVNNNIVDSIEKKDNARTEELLDIYIKNKIITNCIYTIINTIIKTEHNYSEHNYFRDILYDYTREHNIVSMLSIEPAKIHFIALN